MLDQFVGMIVAGAAVTAATIAAAVISHKKKRDETDKNPVSESRFNEKGFDSSGRDKARRTADYYVPEFNALKNDLPSIKKNIDQNEFRYVFADIRVDLERAIKLYLEHWNGSYEGTKLYSLISECEDYLDEEFINKLHSARIHCNEALHSPPKKKEHRHVYFCYKILEEMINEIKEFAS